MRQLELLARLAHPAASKIVLLVLDGVGDLRTADQQRTALEVAVTPNLDALAARSALGRIVPVATGITPGSGPGHLALFGYDPTTSEADIGRGILEALGLGLELKRGEVAARGNFATADGEGRLTDRRAGRIPTDECRRLVDSLNSALAGMQRAEVRVAAGEAHRFVLLVSGEGLSAEIADTDPQELGVPPLSPRALVPAAHQTAAILHEAIERMERAISNEPKANRVLLRGFSQMPSLRPLSELYQLRCAAFAGYPLYRGVASACGMEVVPCGKRVGEILSTVEEHWDRFDYFFLHVKQTDQAGEDGDLTAKAKTIEEVDATLPRLLALKSDVVAITGDHSTPAPMKAHSFHPVPLLIHSPVAFVDSCRRLTEEEALRGYLGTFPSRELMGLLLAHAGRLAKFGA